MPKLNMLNYMNSEQKEQFCCHQTRFLGSKWTTNAFAAGSAPDPAGGAYTYSAPPDPRGLIIIGIPSPTHSFTPGLNPSISANPPYRSLSFFSFGIHYMDFPDCLLLLLSISVFFTF